MRRPLTHAHFIVYSLSPTWRCAAMLACALGVAACGGGGGSSSGDNAPPPQPDPQFRVSAASPFAPGCDGVPASGTLYINAEVEPMLAVNPRNPNHLVGVWQQDRWSTGGARGLLTGVSLDGGRTWAQSMAAFSHCTGGNAANGGDYARASDPWVSFAPDGTVYQIALSFNGGVLLPGSSSAILASRSTDGGMTWGNPVTLIRDSEQFFNDKEALTADPTDARFVYAVWDRLEGETRGPSFFSRTADGGVSWEPARAIYDPGLSAQTLNNQIVVLPDGTLVNFFTQLDFRPNAPEIATLSIMRSQDKGVTWSAPIVISPIQSVGTRDPETGAAVRDGSTLGSIAVGPHGELIAVWQDSRFSDGLRDAIALSRSVDGGLTWSIATRINREPGVPAFIPAATIRTDGTFGVSYYDFRSNTAAPTTLLTDYWLARSIDGVTWTESRITGPFDLAIAPVAEGLFLGDYQALTSIGTLFVPFYVQTNTGDAANRTDVFATLASSVGTARALAAEAKESGVRSVAAEPMAMTPQLAQKLRDAATTAVQRRLMRGSQPTSPQSP
jgi:hypothetical protein